MDHVKQWYEERWWEDQHNDKIRERNEGEVVEILA